MTQTAEATASDIRDLLNECYATAQEQGFDGSFREWDPTAPDLEYVTDKIGYKPTEGTWRAAGLAWVGGAHCR